MSWVAVAVGVGGAVVGAVSSNNAANKGAKATRDANNASIEEQRRQFDLTRGDQMPWLDAGKGALARLTQASTGDMSGFQQSPDYQWTLQQGMQGLDRSAAARGGLFSGGHQADLMKYGQGLASTEYGNWWNRQAGLANVGQTTASGLGSLGMGMANSIGNLNANTAQARASSYAQQGQNYGQLAGIIGQGVAQGYGYNSARNGNGSGWYFGSQPGKG